MKKKWIWIFCFFILCGCQVNKKPVLLDDYNQFIEALNEQDTFKEASQYFDVDITLYSLKEDEYRYDVFIHNVTETLYEIKAVCMDDTYNEYYPSLGLYDEENVTLANYTDKANHIYKGVNLSGITYRSKVTVKILIEFKDAQGKYHHEYFIRTKEVGE